jgi:hypothetical protein
MHHPSWKGPTIAWPNPAILGAPSSLENSQICKIVANRKNSQGLDCREVYSDSKAMKSLASKQSPHIFHGSLRRRASCHCSWRHTGLIVHEHPQYVPRKDIKIQPQDITRYHKIKRASPTLRHRFPWQCPHRTDGYSHVLRMKLNTRHILYNRGPSVWWHSCLTDKSLPQNKKKIYSTLKSERSKCHAFTLLLRCSTKSCTHSFLRLPLYPRPQEDVLSDKILCSAKDGLNISSSMQDDAKFASKVRRTAVQNSLKFSCPRPFGSMPKRQAATWMDL